MRTRITPVALVALCLAAGIALAQTPAASAKSLYDRLGGAYNIAAVVDDFIDRVYANDTLNANPNIAKARSEPRKAGLKFHLTNQVCMATGGPCKYTGLDMKTAHAGFRITPKDWEALKADFSATLNAFKVPDAEQKELFAIVESTRGDIVVEPAAAN
jgi:hemoglobin